MSSILKKFVAVLQVMTIVASPAMASNPYEEERVPVKKEPVSDASIYELPSAKRNREEPSVPTWPMFTYEILKKASVGLKINPAKGRDNCLPCCIAFYNWVSSNKLEPASNKYKIQHNIDLFDNHAVLINPDEVSKFEVKQSVIFIGDELREYDVQHADKQIVFRAFDARQFAEELHSIKLRNANGGKCVSGLIYFDWLKVAKNRYWEKPEDQVRSGHFFNFYIYELEGQPKVALIIDPQLGEIFELNEFIVTYSHAISPKAFIWTDRTNPATGPAAEAIKLEPPAQPKKLKLADNILNVTASWDVPFKVEPDDTKIPDPFGLAQTTFSEDHPNSNAQPYKKIMIGKKSITIRRPALRIFSPAEPQPSNQHYPIDIDLLSDEPEVTVARHSVPRAGKSPMQPQAQIAPLSAKRSRSESSSEKGSGQASSNPPLKKLVIKLPIEAVIKERQKQTLEAMSQPHSALFRTSIQPDNNHLPLINYLLSEYLTPVDAASFAQACRLGRELAIMWHFRMDNQIHHRLYKVIDNKEDDAFNYARDVFYANRDLRSIDLSPYRSATGLEFGIFFENISDWNKNLRRLDLGFKASVETVTDNMIGLISENCSHLVDVSLQHRKNITSAAIKRLVSNCKNLRRLNLAYGKYKPAVIDQILKQDQLTHLDLSGSEWLNDSLANKLAKGLPNLLHLNLSGNSKLSVAGIRAILSQCQSLRSLNIDSCLPEDSKVSDLTDLLPNLQNLNIVDLNLTSGDLNAIISTCKELRSLEVTGCVDLLDENSPKLFRDHKNLECLMVASSMNRCATLKLIFPQNEGQPLTLKLQKSRQLGTANRANNLPDQIDFDNLKVLAKAFPAIRSLDSLNIPMPREALVEVLKQLKYQNRLNLARMTSVNESDEQHLLMMFSKCVALSSLSMSAHNLSLETIARFVKHISQLQKLTLREVTLEKFSNSVITQPLEILLHQMSPQQTLELHTIDEATFVALCEMQKQHQPMLKVIWNDDYRYALGFK